MFSSTRILTALLSRFIPRETLDLYDGLDWDAAIAPLIKSAVVYPDYYRSQNFHGIEDGYLNKIAPITYDFVTAIATPPNELGIRRHMINAIAGEPQRILDLGCGTGTGTLMLAERFPTAEIIGLDLSPYMLVMAQRKGNERDISSIHWQQGLAESTGFESASFDLITISMMFHEMPRDVIQEVLIECDRLLKSQGQLLILDGHQGKLRRMKWLTELFREPYSYHYAQEDIRTGLVEQGFQLSHHCSLGWINQLTAAIKY